MTTPTGPVDPADRQRKVMASIVAERQRAEQQRAQAPKVAVDPEVVRLANEQIAAAQANGDRLASIALKRQLQQYLTNPYPTRLKGYDA